MTMALTLLAMAVVSAPAEACDAVNRIQSTAPADGAVDVPLNTQIFVFYERTSSGLDVNLAGPTSPVSATVSMRSGGSLEVLAPAVAVLTPDQPLQANTTYTVTLEGPALEVGGSAVSSHQVRFTTGSAADTTPPTFAGMQSLSGQVLADDGASEACNAGPERWSLAIGGGAPVEDAVAYTVVRNGFTVAVAPTPDVLYQTLPEPGAGQICLVLHALDLAGNVDPNSVQTCIRPQDLVDEPIDPGTDTAVDTWREDTWREDTWREDTWRDTWRYDTDWYSPRRGCDGGTVAICGLRSPSSSLAYGPMLLGLFLLRRRR